VNLKRDRFATSTLFFANGFGFGGWSATIAPMQRALGLSNAELGLLLFMLAAGAVSFMPLAGAVGPRLGGTGRVAAGAGLAFGLCFAAAGLAPGAWTLALVGLAIGASNGLLVAVMVAAAMRGLSPGEAQKATQSPFGWPPPALIGLAAVAFLCFMVEGAMIDWDGVYLVSLGVGAAAAPLGYAAFASTMIAGRLLGDRVIARTGRLPAVIGGAALAAAGLGVACVWPSLVPAAVGFALVGAGLSNVVPALFSESAAHASSPARGIAAVATAGYSGLLAGPPLVGALASLTDLRAAFAGLAALALFAAGLGWRARL